MVNSRLVWYLEKHSIITAYQSGFRKSRSTIDQIIRLESAVREAFVPGPVAERSNAQSCPLAVIARRSLCPEKLGSNPGQGSKGINFSGWHGLDMSVTVTKRR